MSIIYKYIFKEIFRYIGIVLGAVIGIYIAIDFFEKIDNFMEANVPVTKAFIFFIYQTPFIAAQIMPLCLLLAVLIVFGVMNRNNEILALKSSGISIYHLLKPVLLIGVLMSLVLFLFSELIIPISSERANEIWLRDVRHKSAFISKEKNIWRKDSRIISHIKYYNSVEQSIFGLTLYHFDKDFDLVRRVDAEKGMFKAGKWHLFGLIEQILDKKTGNYQVISYEEKVVRLDWVPEDLKIAVKTSEEMNFKELREYIRKVEIEGYVAIHYKVDLYAKIAFPLVCVIMALVGTGIALSGKTKEGMPVSIAYGIGIAFLYWIFYSFCLSLGYGEMLPPLIAVWAANFIFLCVGGVLLLNAE